MADRPPGKDQSPRKDAQRDNPAEAEREKQAQELAEEVQAACETGVDQPENANQPGNPAAELGEALAAEKDRVLRLQAEMENLRARTSREVSDIQRYAAMPILRDLLPVIDNVDRAIEAAEQNTGEGIVQGFKLVRQQLLTVLEQHHCRPIEAMGAPFNPDFHEAILQQPSDEQPANHVMHVAQEGYQLHDRVVRPAQVIISSGPAEVSS